MKKIGNTEAKESRMGRFLRRFVKDESGQGAMEYIVIALLIGAAVVALVMVLSGNLRNAGDKINKITASKTVDEVKGHSDDLNTQRDALNQQNKTAAEAGDKIGGDFQTK